MAEEKKTTTYKSRKSRSEFTVSGTPTRAYLTASGEAATNPNVIKMIDNVRRTKTDFATADWEARMLSNTY